MTAAMPDRESTACPSPARVPRAKLGELELRVALDPDEGVCQVIVNERDDEVHVRVMVCYEEVEDEDEPRPRRREYMDCPVRVWLDRPLGERAVIYVDDDEELPLYVPEYLNSVVQPDHGYHPANRRRRRPAASDPADDAEPPWHPDHHLR